MARSLVWSVYLSFTTREHRNKVYCSTSFHEWFVNALRSQLIKNTISFKKMDCCFDEGVIWP